MKTTNLKFLLSCIIVLYNSIIAFAGTKIIQGRICDNSGKGLQKVVVSNGNQVTTTDRNGIYELSGNFDLGLVFISSPDGYEPVAKEGNRVKFWLPVDSMRHKGYDFELRKLPSDSSATLLAVADLQISDRAGDRERLKNLYVPQLNRAIDSLKHQGKLPFLISLGDQTCEYYWNETGYGLEDFNRDFNVNCPVYLTMGNHDNDPCKPGDHLASSTWRQINGPNYYSFNRGGVHFVVLDNIYYKNADGAPEHPGRKDYATEMTESQLNWLNQDLEMVKDKSLPIFLAMHGILLSYPEAEGSTPKKTYRMVVGAERMDSILQRFEDVRILSGHAHKMHFMHSPDGRLKEYNYAAACGTWWPYKIRPNRENFWMCNDGSPWGFGIWDISGKTLNHIYKGFGFATDYQMRVYDLNKVYVKDSTLSKDYLPGDELNRNRILVNVWAYEPGGKVRIFENGKELTVKRIKAQDPMHFNLRAIPLMGMGVEINNSLLPEKTTHIFTATAEKADSEIRVEFTDCYGNIFTERLER